MMTLALLLALPTFISFQNYAHAEQEVYGCPTTYRFERVVEFATPTSNALSLIEKRQQARAIETAKAWLKTDLIEAWRSDLQKYEDGFARLSGVPNIELTQLKNQVRQTATLKLDTFILSNIRMDHCFPITGFNFEVLHTTDEHVYFSHDVSLSQLNLSHSDHRVRLARTTQKILNTQLSNLTTKDLRTRVHLTGKGFTTKKWQLLLDADSSRILMHWPLGILDKTLASCSAALNYLTQPQERY